VVRVCLAASLQPARSHAARRPSAHAVVCQTAGNAAAGSAARQPRRTAAIRRPRLPSLLPPDKQAQR